jgi:hypothetical protein
LYSRRTRVGFFVFWVAAALAASGQTASPPAGNSVQNDQATVRDFQMRVSRYMELRKKEAGTPPKKPTASSEKLASNRDQLANSIRLARADARQGDIFTETIAQYFRRQITSALRSNEGSKIRATLKHAEPLRGFQLRVNEQYPDGVPLQTMPPTVLLKLPTLPKELQYRLVGNDLALLDTAPNTILDFIPNVFPQ